MRSRAWHWSIVHVQTHHSPPEGVCVALEVGLKRIGAHGVLLGEVDEVAGEDESQEANVESGDQFLSVNVNHRPQQSPGPALSSSAEARFNSPHFDF